MAIFVNPSLLTNGNGSELAPFNTWDSVTYSPGERYLQRAGTTFNGKVTVSSGGSSDDARVTIDSYGGNEKAKINGDGQARCVEVSVGSHFVTLKNLDIFGANNRGPATVRGVAVGSNDSNKTNNLTIDSCSIHDIGYTSPTDDANGISAFGDDLVVLRSVINGVADDGIWVSGLRPVVGLSHIYDVSQSGRVAGDCIQFGSNTCSDYWVFRNILDHSSVEMKQCFIDGGGSSTGGLFEFNRCLMGTDLTADSKVINIQNLNAVVRGNYSTGGHNAYWLGSVLAYGNAAVNKRNHGFLVGNGHTSIIANNLAIGQGLGAGNGFRAESGITSVAFYNNIAMNNDNGFVCYKTDPLNNGLTVENNIAFNNSFNAHTGYTAPVSNLNVDPQLDGDYIPATGSAAIGGGLKWWSNARPCDINGEPFPDIGLDVGVIQTLSHEFHPYNIR